MHTLTYEDLTRQRNSITHLFQVQQPLHNFLVVPSQSTVQSTDMVAIVLLGIHKQRKDV